MVDAVRSRLRVVVTGDQQDIRRAKIAADVRIGRRHLGQHAEALVTVR